VFQKAVHILYLIRFSDILHTSILYLLQHLLNEITFDLNICHTCSPLPV